jgi:hypothetical protein
VINLGADVPVDQVVRACKIHRPIMVTGTALMTTTMTAFPKIAAQLEDLNLNIPFVCGGDQVRRIDIWRSPVEIDGFRAGISAAISERNRRVAGSGSRLYRPVPCEIWQGKGVSTSFLRKAYMEDTT